jgi:hypothetical protein
MIFKIFEVDIIREERVFKEYKEYRWRFFKIFIFMHICVRAHLFVLILFATYALSSNYSINKRRFLDSDLRGARISVV